MSDTAIQTPETDTDPPVERLLDLERLMLADTSAPMPAEVRRVAHEAAVRMFGLDPEEVGLREPGSQLGPYRLERLLGCGGQALVYEATDTDLGRRVALKVPRPGVGDRLLKEARAVGALSHPHVVRVEALREHDGVAYLVMEHCDEGNLYDLLEGHPDGLPLDLVKAIADQVLQALGHAHAQGVIHRDVKPGNVLFRRGVAKLGDFGIGKRVEEDAFEHSVFSQASQMTQGAVGTPLYMAPEQRDRTLLRGATLDGRTDLYSFGRMLWYMLTGKTPDDYKPASRIRTGLDAGWDELIWALTERDRDARPADAAAVRARLAALPGDPPKRTRVRLEPPPGSTGSGVRAELLAPYKPEWEKPPHLRKHAQRRHLFRKVAGVLGALCVVLAGGAAFFMFTRPHEARIVGRHLSDMDDRDDVPRPMVSSRTSWSGNIQDWRRHTKSKPKRTDVFTATARAGSAYDDYTRQLVRRADNELRVNNLKEARKLLEDAILRYQRDPNAWALLAEVYVRQGLHRKGTRAAERARKLDPNRYGASWYWERLRPLIDGKTQAELQSKTRGARAQ